MFSFNFLEMLECCSLHSYEKIANSIIQLSNFGLKKAIKIIRILILSECPIFASFILIHSEKNHGERENDTSDRVELGCLVKTWIPTVRSALDVAVELFMCGM